jgi:hypothetical protein
MKPCRSSWVAQIAICTSLSFTERSMEADFSGIFGADFKILASLEMTPGETRVEWRRLILSIQHIPKLPYERQHRILVPILKEALRCLEAGGLEGTACLKQFPRAACPVSNGRQPFQAQYYS